MRRFLALGCVLLAVTRAESLFKAASLSGDSSVDAKISYPSKFKNLPTIDESTKKLAFSIDLAKPAKPPQAFVRFTLLEDGTSTVFSTKVDKSTLKLSLSINILARDLEFKSGKAVVDVLVAGDSVSTQAWTLGELNLKLPIRPNVKSTPLYQRHLLYESDAALSPLEEIHHVFRKPEKRAPALIAYSMSLAAIGVSTTGIFGMWWLGRPKTAAKFSIHKLAYVCLLCGFCGVYASYFWSAKMMTLIKPLCAMFAALYFLGTKL